MRRLLPLPILLFIGVIFHQTVTAQTRGHDFVRCNTMEHREQMLQQQPDNFQSFEDFNEWIAEKQAEMTANKTLAGERTIPVVVHIIHDGDAVGVDENITEAQVLSQIQVLNEDFGKMRGSRGNNTHFDGADSRIEWCMAQIDPNGNPSNGITRTDLGQAEWLPNDIDNTVKPATQWDPTQYCNIWVLNLGDGLLGYAQFPNGPPGTDGVVIGTTTFGTQDANDGTFYISPPYDLGRTTTHEMGHWLGLYHIWGDANCGDDLCADTPTQEGPSSGCPNTTTCDGNKDMVENYMDYSNDGCMNIFTFGQKARMDAVLANAPQRMELLTSNKCVPPSEILFVDKTITTTETSDVVTDCSGYKDYTVTMRISAEPSADAFLNFVLNGTATPGPGNDYEILQNAVTFPNNSGSTRSFTVRVYNDAYVEGTETIEIGYTVTTTGDAVAGSWNQLFTITIADDDIDPDQGGTEADFITQNFASGIPADWTNVDNTNGGGLWEYSLSPPNNWNQGAFGFTTETNGYVMFDSDTKGGDGFPEDAMLTTKAYDCSGVFGVKLKFQHVFCKFQNDITTVGISNDGTNFTYYPMNTGITVSNTCTPQPASEEIDISAIADNQATVYVQFRYQGDWDYWWVIDDIALNGSGAAHVQANTTAAAKEEHLGPFGTVNYYDDVSGNIMLTVENLSAHDYGCTTVEVHRAGTSSAMAWNPDPVEYIASKTFRVVPEFNNPTGNYKITLYYLGMEVQGWESATGRTSIDLNLIKTDGDITNTQPSDDREYALDAEVDYYGDYKYTGTFYTGFSDFGIGPQDAVLLPFNLVYFTGEKQREGNYLKWRSEREVESYEYQLQRSMDGISFETIANIAAIGSGDNPADYNYLDRDYQYGVNYYRLKHVKLDNETSFSEIISIKIAEIPEEVHLFPNPVKGTARVKINSLLEEGGINLRVLNTLGQVLMEIPVSLTVGDNYFDLDLKELNTGVYFLQIQGGEQDKTTYKFLKY